MQFRLLTVPARFGLSIQQMEAAASSTDPDLAAGFADLDAVMCVVHSVPLWLRLSHAAVVRFSVLGAPGGAADDAEELQALLGGRTAVMPSR